MDGAAVDGLARWIGPLSMTSWTAAQAGRDVYEHVQKAIDCDTAIRSDNDCRLPFLDDRRTVKMVANAQGITVVNRAIDVADAGKNAPVGGPSTAAVRC